MLFVPQILVRSLVLGVFTVTLQGCGQQGPLYLPQSDGSHRATLPESLLPTLEKTKAGNTVPPASAPLTSQ